MCHYLKRAVVIVTIIIMTHLCHAVEKNLVSEDVTRKAADYFVLTNFGEHEPILYDSFSYYDLDEARIADIYVYAKNTKWLGQKQLLLEHIYRTSQALDDVSSKIRDLHSSRYQDDNVLVEKHSGEIGDDMSIQAQLAGYSSYADQLLRSVSGYDDFITVYISASSNKMPLWEYREGLPEKYQTHRIEQVYARKSSPLPQNIVIYYNGPAQIFVKDAHTKSLLHLEDKTIEASLEKLGGYVFNNVPLPEEYRDANKLVWQELLAKGLNDLLDEFSINTRAAAVISDVPYFNQHVWNSFVCTGGGSCAVMAAASALFYRDDNNGSYWNMVPFGWKTGSNYQSETAGFYNTPGDSPDTHPIHGWPLYYGLEQSLVKLAQRVGYNFNSGGTPIDWSDFDAGLQGYTNTDRGLNFSFVKKRKTITSSPHSYAEIKQQIDWYRPMVLRVNKFSWTSAFDSFPVSGGHDIAIVAYNDSFIFGGQNYGNCIGVYTNGSQDNYFVVYWNYVNLLSTQNILYTQPWTLAITQGGNSGTWLNGPNPTSPANISSSGPGSIYFAWQSISGANRYKLQVSTNQTFTNNYIYNVELTSTSTALTISNLGQYYWRVAARNSSGNWCQFGSTYSFTIANPTLSVSPSSLSFGNVVVNTYSSPQSYTLTGSNLTGNVTVTAPSRYEVSLSSGSGYSSSLSIIPSSGSVNRTIYVRFNPNANGTASGNVSNASTGATTRNVAVSGNGVTPTLAVSPSSLSFGNVVVNTYSSPQSYTLTGSNLTGNVTVTAPSRYEVSLSSGSGYSNSLSITPSSGSVNRTIYVRFNPNANGTVSGNVSNASTGVTTRNVAVSGIGVTPTLAVSPSSLSFGNVPANTYSSPQSYTLTGSNLTGNVTVTAPSRYDVSLSSGSGYSSSLSITPSSGSVNRTIYVRFNPNANGTVSGNVSNESTGATPRNVSVSGIGVTPTLAVSPSSLSFGNVVVNTYSSPQSYTLTGSNLTGNVAVTAPSRYEVSLSSGSGYGNSLSITPSSGGVNRTIYVRFNPNANSTASGNVSNASTGATTRNVAVNGQGIDPIVPVLFVSPSSINFGDVLVGTCSSPQSYNLTGSNLTGNVTVTASNVFQVSLSSGSGYGSSLSIPTSGGNINSTIYVRFCPISTGSGSGQISHSASDAATLYLSVSGTGVAQLLTISPTSQNVASTPGSFPIYVSSNISWTVTSSHPWLTYSPTNGSNNATINVSYSSNPDASPRTGTITVTGGGIARTCSVTQSGVSPSNEHNVSILNGWNIISSYIVPDDLNALNYFLPLISNGALIKVQNQSGNALEYLDFLGQWVNYIGDVNPQQGYRLRSNADTVFNNMGSTIGLPQSIPLSTGWNLVSYPYPESQNALQILQGLIDSNTLVKAQSQDGNALEYLSFLGQWVNYIGDFVPGQGYAINVNQQTNLTYNTVSASISKGNMHIYSGSISEDPYRNSNTSHFQPAWEGNGWHHFNTYLVVDDTFRSITSAGDEIAIFDGMICVGAVVYSGQQPIVSILSSMNDDSVDDINGYIPGHSYSLRVWLSNEQTELTDFDLTLLEGSEVFQVGGTAVVSLSSTLDVDDVTVIPMESSRIASIYPNPFNPETIINYDISKGSSVSLAVYNAKGQLVKKLLSEYRDAGRHQCLWDGADSTGKAAPSGLYYVRLINGRSSNVKKMIITK